MTMILVVDDCEFDRRLIDGLLRNCSGYSVQIVSSGEAALEAVAAAEPDVVLTDIQMPGMDGLELVSRLRASHPRLPTILMTSLGSDDIAFRALRAGASHYVPKRLLSQALLDTLRTVLSLASEERSKLRLMRCLTSCRLDFVLENDPQLVPPLVAHLQNAAGQVGLCDEGDQIRLGVALEEALVNALYHGNLAISSDVREGDRDEYYKLADVRRRQRPYCERRIHISAALASDQGVFVIRDEGEGFDPASLADPCEAQLDKLSGRGLLLMRTFMDAVRHNPRGNEVTLVKRRTVVSAA